jgi:hypothetical protein
MDLRSHRVQLVLTALAASASTAAALTAYTTWTRSKKRDDLRRDVLRSLDASFPADVTLRGDEPDVNLKGPLPPAAPDARAPAQLADEEMPYNEELIREQLARNYAFFGDEGMARIRQGSVVIVGCGGVGSWAAVMLARS